MERWTLRSERASQTSARKKDPGDVFMLYVCITYVLIGCHVQEPLSTLSDTGKKDWWLSVWRDWWLSIRLQQHGSIVCLATSCLWQGQVSRQKMLGCAGTSSSSSAHGAPDSQLESELLELEEELESISTPHSPCTTCGTCGLGSGARRRSTSSGTCHSGPRLRFFRGVLGAWLHSKPFF